MGRRGASLSPSLLLASLFLLSGCFEETHHADPNPAANPGDADNEPSEDASTTTVEEPVQPTWNGPTSSQVPAAREPATASNLTGVPAIVFEGRRVEGSEALVWTGSQARNWTFDLIVPDGEDWRVEVAVRWHEGAGVAMTLWGPAGNVLLSQSEAASYSSLNYGLAGPVASGTYGLLVEPASEGVHEVTLQFERRPWVPDGEGALLPDLFPAAVGDLMINVPGLGDVSKRCTPDAPAHETGSRCLEAVFEVENLGPGPFQFGPETYPYCSECGSPPSGSSGTGSGCGSGSGPGSGGGGGSGNPSSCFKDWTQTIWHANGTQETFVLVSESHQPPGPFSAALYEHDMATGARGFMVAAGPRFRWAFHESDLRASESPGTTHYRDWAPVCAGSAPRCWDGLSPGAVGLVPMIRDGGAIDITDVDDGVYQLVFSIQPDFGFVEQNAFYTEMTVLIRIEGSTVTLLEP